MKRDVSNLKSEIEIIKLREVEFKRKVKTQNDIITKYVNTNVQSPAIRFEIMKFPIVSVESGCLFMHS